MRTKSKIVVVLSLTGVTLASGCSGSTSEPGGADPVPQEQFVTKFVDAVCDNIGSCCAAEGYAYDAEKCKAVAKSQYDAVFEPSPNVVYDAARGGSCIQAVKQAASSCGALDLDGSAACQGVYVGQLPAGAACESSMECAAPAGGDATCDGQGSGKGTCVVEKRGVEGDGCYATCTEAGSAIDCGSSGGDPSSASCYTNDGLYCSSAFVCEKLAALGAACASGGCVDGAYCDAGTCKHLPEAGAPCAVGNECAEGAYCDASSTCVAAKQPGEACVDFDECAEGHCYQGVCKRSSLASPAVCDGSSGTN
jgi:hypothetical protein